MPRRMDSHRLPRVFRPVRQMATRHRTRVLAATPTFEMRRTGTRRTCGRTAATDCTNSICRNSSCDYEKHGEYQSHRPIKPFLYHGSLSVRSYLHKINTILTACQSVDPAAATQGMNKLARDPCERIKAKPATLAPRNGKGPSLCGDATPPQGPRKPVFPDPCLPRRKTADNVRGPPARHPAYPGADEVHHVTEANARASISLNSRSVSISIFTPPSTFAIDRI